MIDASEVFREIGVENGTECICTKEYTFNNTVTFYKGESYQVDLGTKIDSDLIAVIQPDYPAYVGMSKSRFVEYFKILN